MSSTSFSQSDTISWFDETYRKRGFKYVRPFDAYPIYLQLLEVEKGKSLLDVACGPGQLLRAALMRGLKANGLDASEVAIEIAGKNAEGSEVRVGNSEALPFQDESFDYVTCLGSIERFFDRDKALSEMRRVGKPGARFCFLVRNSWTPAWKLWHRGLRAQNHEGHQDALDLDGWKALLARNGFAVRGLYMDQWPRQRIRRFFRGLRSHDWKRDEKVARPLIPMRFVNEFIFILEKAEPADS